MNCIPKTVHYCWFGGQAKPDFVLNNIETWKRHLTDYEILEWNESNFDINCCQYVAEAHACKKYAFVSDYARLYALYNVGGIYFDVDVEVCKSLDELLTVSGVILGFEEFDFVASSTMIASKGSSFIFDFMESYQTRVFVQDGGELDQTTNVRILTQRAEDIGLLANGNEQQLYYGDESVLVLDQLKFSPLDYANHVNHSDLTTFTVHHFEQTWAGPQGKIKKMIKLVVLKLIGGAGIKRLRLIVSLLKFNKRKDD